MRGLILQIVVVLLAGAGLFQPRIGLLAWIWYGAMHPNFFAWMPFAGNMSMLLAVTTLIGSIRNIGALSLWLTEPIPLGLILLLIPSGLSAVFAVQPALAYSPFVDYTSMMLMVLMIPVLIQTVEHLRIAMAVLAFSVGALGIKFGLWGLLNGGAQYSGGFAMLDNNTLAAVFLSALPLCWYLVAVTESKILKAGYLFNFGMLVAAIVMTHSRGAALALAAEFLLIMAWSKRKTGLVLVLLLAAGPAVYLVRDTYISRLSTLKSPQEESSALSRIVSARAAVRMWQDYPLLGVGFGAANQIRLSSKYSGGDALWSDLVIHNTYLQVLVDSGIFAAIIYVGLLAGTLLWLGASARRARNSHPELMPYPLALRTALAGFAIATIFLSRVQSEVAYTLLAAAAAWRIIERRLAENDDENNADPPDTARVEMEVGAQ
jgi:probable O-glycosylation ligase (exosortase A-associated)